MAKYEGRITGDFNDVINKLHNEIMDSAVSMNLVDESNCQIGNTNIAIRVYDKYFMRNESRASLSLTVAGHDNDLFISAIGAGGGRGVFFNYSLGAEDSMVDAVRYFIEKMVK